MTALNEERYRLFGKGPGCRRQRRSLNQDSADLSSRPFFQDGRLIFTVSVHPSCDTAGRAALAVNNKQRQATTGNNKQRNITSRNNTQQQATASNNKPQQATTQKVDEGRHPSFGEALRIASIASGFAKRVVKKTARLAICDRPTRLSDGRRMHRKTPLSRQLAVTSSRRKDSDVAPCTPSKRKHLPIADMSDNKVELRAARRRHRCKSSACLPEQGQVETPNDHMPESLLHALPGSDGLQSCTAAPQQATRKRRWRADLW